MNSKVSQKILQFLLKIPKGKVTTYSELGRKAGIHPRVVGQILNKNKEPERFPCYKVVKSSGELGGYSRGLKEKARLLKKDGIEIKNDRVDLEKFGWRFV